MSKKNITEEYTINDTTINTDVEHKQEKIKFFKGFEYKKLLITILVVLSIGGIYGTYYFYAKYTAIKANPNLEAQKETELLISALGKLIELPADETPTIATISDKEKLKDQLFFKAAENGDKLFAYNTAMIAILYRPSSNKIINVAPITINNQPQNLTQDAKGNKIVPELNP